MLSESELIDKIVHSAYAFHIATGELPNVVYVSKYMIPYVKLNGYPTLRICLMADLVFDDRSPFENTKDCYLTVKTHKNEGGYAAGDCVFVTRE